MNQTDGVLFLLQIAAMLAVAQLFGRLLRRFGQPAVLGELLGGVVLGPTVLGSLAPDGYDWLFPAGGATAIARDAVVTFGMLFFLFAAGLEVNLAIVGRLGAHIAWTAVSGIALPFVLGVGLVLAWPALWGAQAAADPAVFALFIGAALSISALPVIARILIDLDLLHRDFGVIVMSAATFNDLIGWTLFAVVLSLFVPGAGAGGSVGSTIMLTLAFFVLVLGPGRWGAQRVAPWVYRYLCLPGALLDIALVPVLLAAAAAEAIGLHAFLGAFLVGVAASQNLPQRSPAHESLHRFAVGFFAPIYFVSVGLKADFGANFDPVLVALVFLVATIGKTVGVGLGARLGGLPSREAWAVGFAMNARGAMEIILASVALQHQLISPRVFVALIVMAVATSMLSGPVIQRLLRANPSPQP